MVKIEGDYRISYDEYTDTLYISVLDMAHADNCYIDDNYIWVRKCNNNIIGITILGFKDQEESTYELIKQYFPTFEYSYLNDIY
jgi:hypothetical protein